MYKSLYLIFITVIFSHILTSCSIIFSTRELDMAPFSENAGILFGEAAKISRPFKFQHLKAYTDAPEALILYKKSIPLVQTLHGIVYYSHQVVAINDSPLKQKDKNRKLAQYLAEVLKEAGKEGRLDSLGLSRQTLDLALRNMQNASSYLDALAEAGPVVNSVVLSIQTRLDGLQADIQAVIAAFDKRIETDFALPRANYLGLKDLQGQTMGSLKLVYQLETGERTGLDSLLYRDASLKKYFSSYPLFSDTDLQAAEQQLLARLGQIDQVLNQLNEEVAEYHAKQDEVEEWRLNVDEKIRIARNAISVWAQSHRNLGAGIPVPPLVDVSSIATGLVGSAAQKLIP